MKKPFTFWIPLGLLSLFIPGFLVAQEGFLSEDLPPDISNGWVATDGLGRKLPNHLETGLPRSNKYVAMFYWSWHTFEKIEVEPINVNQIISKYPEAINDYDHPQWTPSDFYRYHHWSESLFGYYVSTDRWVIRKHAEMLADAGVDVVFFDCTNKTWMWDDATQAIGEEWTRARNEGVRAPSMVFMCPFSPLDNSADLITQIYEKIYKKGLYKDLWFYWEGKPLIMGYPDNVSDEIKEFFTFRPGQPDYKKGPSRSDQWGWLELYPQNGYVEYAPEKYEQITVGVAMNATDSLAPAAMNDTLQVYGRSYTQQSGMDNRPGAVNYGLNFQEQWDRAFEVDPKVVFVTGWNEWVAGRSKKWQGTSNAFPDQYSQENSRDIEPMKGGHGDHYYYQLVNNVRRFKGVSPPETPSGPKSLKIDGDFDEWKDVSPLFRDHKDAAKPRDHRGYGSTWYKNSTGRNDILLSRVCRDEEFIYFFVETAEPISPPSKRWMTLFLDMDRDKKTGWEGYDFVLNRLAPRNGKSVLEKCAGGWKWNKIGGVAYQVTGNQMEIRIPRDVLNMGSPTGSFEFKWSDNMQQAGDIMDFYIHGDAAPSGRFNYLYQTF